MALRPPSLPMTAFIAFLIVLALVEAPLSECSTLPEPRLVIYVQTTHQVDGSPISILPLIEEPGITATHLIIAAFHINEDSEIHLNDHDPNDPTFATLWSEVELIKAAGVKVMGMVGGAAPGSFTTATLDGDDSVFEKYYQQLYKVVQEYQLEGLDLDVEESMSLDGATRLIRRLRSDFGSDFIITLAPVASALLDHGNLSGFSYSALEATVGTDIAFYNTQFYSGFGTMSTPDDYRNLIAAGWKPQKIVIGQLTSPDKGYGFIPLSELTYTIDNLRARYKEIGGIMGWEYYSSSPGGVDQPWQWAQLVTPILQQRGSHCAKG
ncbi:endo-N-acetyl-beta-D-glucosaminidase precursor [Cordyceps fumosorosea ARSEF 2679]|uniref:Endo-N-acetyl-beta-D-glucosaminidase n=1 Tax=Cordyceps fumosorosea (strain ARSEF 2679) TaxID=1081104 RepID=A0A167DES2_CORFA|nr:endo-N-acetyl-beta-D-glucosaminidase precursor [Cordyceps fumosorosea ARSEF 2679]OAA42294.1 endo-N-acetyl-beta-D-glucosaminidase precursor [Cordyceps fumosorosea ARSEF 2679]